MRDWCQSILQSSFPWFLVTRHQFSVWGHSLSLSIWTLVEEEEEEEEEEEDSLINQTRFFQGDSSDAYYWCGRIGARMRERQRRVKPFRGFCLDAPQCLCVLHTGPFSARYSPVPFCGLEEGEPHVVPCISRARRNPRRETHTHTHTHTLRTGIYIFPMACKHSRPESAPT